MAVHFDVKALKLSIPLPFLPIPCTRSSAFSSPPPPPIDPNPRPPRPRPPLFALLLRSNMMTCLTTALAVMSGLWLDTSAVYAGRLGSRHDGVGVNVGVEHFIATQDSISWQGILANIGSRGSKAGEAAPGVVIASPSKQDPDYFYTWTRDAALTLKVLIEHLLAGNVSLRPTIQQYVSSQAKLQDTSNPSGGPTTGGLGEPKFHVNLTQFTDPWGRPQRDGPPLRATALTIYADWLLANGGSAEASRTVWPVIARDLAYAVAYWNRTGFDLWEEVNGSSFFTVAATHRALVQGAALAKALGEPCPDCESTASQVLCFAQSFWSGARGYIESNINTNAKAKAGRSGKDANSMLSSIHTFDPAAACTDATFQPCSSRALANHKAVVDSFRAIYHVNRGRGPGQAAAVGRYAEDVYQDGNPWYLTTLAAAEQLHDAVYQWRRIGAVSVDSVSLGFFRDVVPSIAVGNYPSGSATYAAILAAVSTYADGFVALVQEYTPRDGSLAEQFDKKSGLPRSAADLTWSYAAFVSMTKRRSGAVALSWGEPSSHVIPAVCSPAAACRSTMTFNIRVQTRFGEAIFLTGSLDELKNWSPTTAIPLSAAGYTPDNPLWTVQIQLPAATNFQYKYIKKTVSGSIVWLRDPNLSANSSTGCGSNGTLSDTWR
ncbi:hypothetical protein E4U21_005724 [Claviceps maximensis]|nr:hypothetical protein E4U21_005724 [Claviceps maximensis]